MNAIGITGVVTSLLSMALSVFTILRVRHLSRQRVEVVSDYARLGFTPSDVLPGYIRSALSDADAPEGVGEAERGDGGRRG